MVMLALPVERAMTRTRASLFHSMLYMQRAGARQLAARRRRVAAVEEEATARASTDRDPSSSREVTALKRASPRASTPLPARHDDPLQLPAIWKHVPKTGSLFPRGKPATAEGIGSGAVQDPFAALSPTALIPSYEPPTPRYPTSILTRIEQSLFHQRGASDEHSEHGSDTFDMPDRATQERIREFACMPDKYRIGKGKGKLKHTFKTLLRQESARAAEDVGVHVCDLAMER